MQSTETVSIAINHFKHKKYVEFMGLEVLSLLVDFAAQDVILSIP